MPLDRSNFPTDFVWGVAASAYQIEGAVDEGGRGPSIWDTFAHTPGKTFEGQTADVTTDHYHRFEDDVALMAELGVTSYRFSISWPRLIPDGVGPVNPEGVDFYRRLATALRSHGIEPHATLYHWDLPQALHERGGWLERDSVQWFTDYAAAAKEALGDLVTFWSTFNEPHCVAFLGYSDGVHAPGHTDPGEAYVVAHHTMLAHHAAIAAMRTTAPHPDDRLGVVLNLIPAWSDEPDDDARRAADGVDAIHNRLFAGAVLDGKYPDVIREYQEAFGVADRTDPADFDGIVAPIDFMGVNYYNINHIGYDPESPGVGQWPGPDGAVLLDPPGHLTDMHWGVEPIGLTWTLNRVHRWAPDLPLYVMENGAAYPDVVADDGSIHDPLRISYIQQHLEATHAAIAEGVDIRGYYVWSLLDNFEWSLGYTMRFGIVRVDYETLERTVKDSGRWYQRFIEGTETT